MDGFESNEGVILIAATNRPDVLDPFCWGLDGLTVELLSTVRMRGREKILEVHTQRFPSVVTLTSKCWDAVPLVLVALTLKIW